VNCAFSLDHYLDVLNLAQDKDYIISNLSDYPVLKEEKLILLRHDVDFSLDYAYEMASMEHAVGYSSTYFILLHGPYYNVLSEHCMELIKAIHGMGHEIGLQLDTRYHMDVDPKILSSIIGEPIHSYAKHYYTITKDFKIKDLNDSRDIPMKYISDSGRNWREGCMCQNISINKYPQLQILTHPLWWVTETKDRNKAVTVLHNHLKDQVDESINEYREILAQYIKDEMIVDIASS
jgi:hypothetical protein